MVPLYLSFSTAGYIRGRVPHRLQIELIRMIEQSALQAFPRHYNFRFLKVTQEAKFKPLKRAISNLIYGYSKSHFIGLLERYFILIIDVRLTGFFS